MSDDSDTVSIASTIEPPPSASSVDDRLRTLKKQRGNRRGQVTKLISRYTVLAHKHAATHTQASLEKLRRDTLTAIEAHDDIQNEIDSTTDDPDSLTDPEDREKHLLLHDELTTNIENLITSSKFHKDAAWMVDTIKTALDSDNIATTSTDDVDSYSSILRELHTSALVLRGDTEVQSLYKKASEFLTELKKKRASVAPPTTSKSSSSSSDSSKPERPRMAPINLEIPKFHGDPLAWEAFELSLKSILTHRAEGFSEADKFAIVRQAIVPSAGKALVADKLKAGDTTDQLLCDLKELYGRPQLVVPTLVKLITNPPRTDQTASSLRKFKEQVLDHYGSLHKLLNGELGRFLPHSLRSCFEGKLREDWERLLFEKLPEPTMEDH